LKHCGKNTKLIDYRKLKDLCYVKFATNQVALISLKAETGLYGFVIKNEEKAAPTPKIPQNLRNYGISNCPPLPYG